jgi:hypothetical protein
MSPRSLESKNNPSKRTSVKAGGKESSSLEVTCSSETSDDFQRTTEHKTCHNYRCEDLDPTRNVLVTPVN